ncbi:ATP-binding protein [Palleronia caenipelagi]|nr:ATP-binding protein [Palleronia caenipelagi]
MTLISLWGFVEETESRREDERSRIIAFIDAIGPSFARAAWQVNNESLSVLLQSIYSQQGVVSVTFKDELVSLGAGPRDVFEGDSSRCGEIFERDFSDFIFSDQRLGSGQLRICYDGKKIAAASPSELLEQIMPFVAGVFVTALLIAFLLSKMIARPLHDLSEHLYRGEKIENFRRYPDNRYRTCDEIDQLVHELKSRTRQLEWEQKVVEISMPEMKDMFVQTDKDLNVVRNNSAFMSAIGSTGAPVRLDAVFDRRTLLTPGLHENVPGPNERLYEVRTVSFGTPSDRGFLYVIRDQTELQRKQQSAIHVEKMSALGTLASGVAHDFNNVLTGIVGHAELLIDRGGLPDDSMEMLANIVNYAQRGASLSRQMLNFAQRKNRTHRIIDARQPLSNLQEISEPLIGKAVELEVNIESDSQIDVDIGLLDSALMNLLINARDAVKDKDRPRIRLLVTDENRSGQPFVRYSVEDNGHGIPKEMMDRVREPFFTTKTYDEGSGLGVAMVTAFVEQCGGYLDIESEVDKGTRASISLPVAARSNTSKSSKQQTGPRQLAHSIFGQRVLIIEDEPILLDMTELILRRHGYITVSVGSVSALRVAGLHKERFDLVLSDVVLKHETVLDALKLFKSGGNTSPFALISGNFPVEIDSEIRAMGNFPRLDKPFHNADLLAFVENAIGDQQRTKALLPEAENI